MSNFLQRTITGFFFVLILISAIAYNAYTFFGLFFLITVLGCWEFYTLFQKNGMQPYKIIGTILGGSLFILTFLITTHVLSIKYMLLILASSMIIFFAELYTKNQEPFKNIAITFLGIIYVALPFSLLNLLVINFEVGIIDYRGQLLLGYFFILWSNDTGAYLAGRKLGKHKLFERISPKKTWEGFFGGMLSGMIVATIFATYFKQINLIHWLIISALIVITGTLGDLVESMFKRSIGVKDSGNILPGHGGILDRFDGLLLSVPIVVTYLLLIVYF